MAGPRIFVGGESPAGKLAISIHYGLIIVLGGVQKLLVARLEEIDAGLAKTLGHVHIMPVNDPAGPVGHVVMNFFRDVE